jgi:cyclin B
MRTILLKWLMQVGRKFQVKDETIQICVQLVDLVLLFETNRISKHNFQLLGVAALFVASKYN